MLLQNLTDKDIEVDTYTAPDGAFIFYNLPEGAYRITVKKLFHLGKAKDITCGKGMAKQVNFDLIF